MENEFGGEWSKTKLDKLESYTHAYLQAMAKQSHWKFIYIDAFAGSGYQKLKKRKSDDFSLMRNDEPTEQAEEFIVGSALRVMKASVERAQRGHASFFEYVFVDNNEAALETLKDVITKEYPSELEKSVFEIGDANVAISERIEEYDWKKTHGLTFIDPFDMSITYDMLCDISNTKSLDVWLLFPLSAVCRVMAKRGVPQNWRPKLNAMYGSDDWQQLYIPDPQTSLFDLLGESTQEERLFRKEGVTEILKYTTSWLNRIFAAASSAPYILKTDTNSPLFALYSAVSSENPKAISLWKKLSDAVLKDTI